MLGFEVQIMHGPGQMFRSLEFALHERLVDHNFGRDISEFEPLPCFDLLTHGLEVALHPIDTNRHAVDE